MQHDLNVNVKESVKRELKKQMKREMRILQKPENKKNQKRAAESIDEREERLAREREYKRTMHNSKQTQSRQEAPEQNQIDTDNSVSKDERRVLQKFHSKMDSIEYKLCPVCNERIPSMVLVNKMCRCYNAKGKKIQEK